MDGLGAERTADRPGTMGTLGFVIWEASGDCTMAAMSYCPQTTLTRGSKMETLLMSSCEAAPEDPAITWWKPDWH